MNFAATAASLGSRPWTRRSVPWLGVLFVAVVVGLSAFDIVRSHRLAVEDTGRELESHARIIAEQTARSVQAVDVVLRHVAGEYRRGRLARLNDDELNGYLRELSVGLKQIDGFGLYDAGGEPRAVSWDAPRAPFSIADLAGFRALRDDPKIDFGIGDATRSPGDGMWMVPLGRRLETPSGEFAGVIGARGRVDYFQGFYRDVQLESGTAVALIHGRGTLLARFPPVEQALGQRFALFEGLLPRRVEGQPGPTRIVSPIDDGERFAVLRWVPDYPLAVIVTRKADVALAAWREHAMGTAARTLALALLAAMLLGVVMRQLRRLDTARESLEASRERFALAVAGSDEGIWDWDRRTDEIFASARARELFGLPPGPDSQPREQWLASVQMHPDDIAGRREAIDAHLEGDTPLYEGEYRVRHPDGSYRWVHVRGLCVRDLQGQPLRMAGSVSDIDARRRAEEELRLSEERYALAMAGLRGGHWVWEVESDALFVSGNLNELFGLPADTCPATRAAYFALVTLHPDDRDRVEQIGQDILSGGLTRVDFEYRILLGDTGTVRWITTRAQVFSNADGRPVRVAGVSVDATERKRTEEALRASEERFALAVAGSDVGVWDWDLNAGLAFESTRARELQGLPPGPELQPLQKLVASLRVHPDDAARRAEGIRAHLAGETPAYECDYRVRHADGEYRWIRVRALCIRDAGGKPYRMAGSVTDIDARRRAEEALRESEQRFALAVAGTNDGILDWDIANDRMFASERAMRIAGIESGVVVRTHDEWVALLDIHADDVPRLKQTFRRRPTDGAEVQEADCRMRHPDGQYHWVRIRGRHLLDASGRAIRWSGSISDIDAQKRTEQALRASEERYQLAVEGAQEGLWDWDLVTDQLFLSPRAQEILWVKPGQPMRSRREWIELTHYHPDDVGRVRAAIADHLHGRTRHFEVEYRLRHHGGDWHWYRQRGVALRDAQGRPYRMAGSMEDVNDRKSAEAERDRLESQLRQSQKLEAMGTLAGGIAHDFNNILAAILGYGEMAQRDAPDGTPQRRHIDAAMSAALRAKSLVERILAFSRSGVGERVPVNVQSVVAEALELVVASLPAGVTLERELDCGDAAVLGDATQIHQVVMNLCANAVQAMKSSGTLRVSVTTARLADAQCVATTQLEPGGYVKLSVTDSGIGIAPQVLERIFDPFFTTKEVGVGTGLGLSLVHGIVADLGGGIDVASQVGAGSTFTVYLPWQGSVEAAHAQQEPVAGGSGETILLVDDEEALVRLGEEMMAELGYEPVGFASSTAALETFRATPQRFDAVLSDEAMPDLTGSELAREIRRIRPDIPIVLMSGYVTPALSARARDIGVADVLAKPLVARDIARSLSTALRE